VGASLASHNGTLRLEWRQGGTRVTWSTGEADTRDAREAWEPVRKLIAAYREQGEDPRPYLKRRSSSTTEPEAPVIPTIRSYSVDWLESKRGEVRPALLRDYRGHLDTYLLRDQIADLPLEALRPGDLALCQARLRQRPSRWGRPLSEKTVRNILGGTLRALVRDATKDGLVTRDLFTGLTAKRWTPPAPDPFTADEWAKVDAWFRGRTYVRCRQRVRHPAFHAFVFALRWHGMRPSEAAGLSWDDLDLGQGLAHVRHSYVLGTLGDPKTDSATRSIELHPEMVALLTALRPLRPAPGAIVFPNLDGARIRPKTFSGIWTDCLQACRVRYRGIYALKDTFVTGTLAAAEQTGEVGQLTTWLVRQTGVRLSTLHKHYEKAWPRDREAVRRTYALLDPGLVATPKAGRLPPG
jgi:integrase